MATKGKVRDAIRVIEKDGWILIRKKGSHRQYKHPVKRGKTTINGHESQDLDVWLWNSIMTQAGLK